MLNKIKDLLCASALKNGQKKNVRAQLEQGKITIKALKMIDHLKDMLCRIKKWQNIYKQKVCFHKNVNKICIQTLRLLEKEGFVV